MGEELGANSTELAIGAEDVFGDPSCPHELAMRTAERGPRGLPAMLGPGPGARRTRGVVDEGLELEERVAGADSERWLLVLRVRPDEQRTVRADELIDATP